MKIAVNYENGQIFQHFGQTKTFKVYTVENNAVTGTELVPGAQEGHHALGRQLAAMQVDVVICGSLGMPMLELLQGAGNEQGFAIDSLQGTMQVDTDGHVTSRWCPAPRLMPAAATTEQRTKRGGSPQKGTASFHIVYVTARPFSQRPAPHGPPAPRWSRCPHRRAPG